MNKRELVISGLLHDQEFLDSLGEKVDSIISLSGYEVFGETCVIDDDMRVIVKLDFAYLDEEYETEFYLCSTPDFKEYEIYDNSDNFIGIVSNEELIGSVLRININQFGYLLNKAVVNSCLKVTNKVLVGDKNEI